MHKSAPTPRTEATTIATLHHLNKAQRARLNCGTLGPVDLHLAISIAETVS